MKLSLKQANAVRALATAVQDFLPGSGARDWAGHITFGTVARDVGVQKFWSPAGSKVPRLIALFEQTLEHQPQDFERLIVRIVKAGLHYRESKRNPIQPDEIRTINGHIQEIGFKFPDLWDPSFLNAIALDDVERAARNVQAVERSAEQQTSSRVLHLRALGELLTELERLWAERNRQAAGFALEKLLNKLFTLFELAPRTPFKLVGEQIDGSFELDNEVYLIEAKWEAEPTKEKDLLIFRGKIEGKSSFTRGVFFAMNGVTSEADHAIRIGKQPTFFVMTGHDLMMVLRDALSLNDFLRRRRRLLAEEAAMTAPFDRVAR